MKEIGKKLEVASEEQITLFVNDIPYRIMCTPENVRELAVGFLISEGIVSSLSEVEFVDAPCLRNGNVLMVKVSSDGGTTTIRSSGCIGVYREKEKIPRVEAKEKFTMREIAESLRFLEIEEYRKTRGYHVASIVGKEGLLFRSYDVGRHNAVDKVIGMALLNETDLSRVFLLLSGRISRGIAMKCARAGIPLVVSKAAILDSAIEVCKKSGVSAVSFATNIALLGDAIA
jgi:FdhD protein